MFLSKEEPSDVIGDLQKSEEMRNFEWISCRAFQTWTGFFSVFYFDRDICGHLCI